MKKNRPSRPCLWLIAAALWAGCWACSLNDPVSDTLPSPLPSSTPAGIREARAWYESHRTGQGISLSVATRSGDALPFCSDPSWKYCVQSENSWAETVEVDMTDRIRLDFVTAENRRAYEETGRYAYRRSFTRLVILTEKDGGKKNGFLMTLLPSPRYIREHGASIRRTLYLNRDTRYDGLVLYHRLDGSFANGWLYRDGRVAAALRCSVGMPATRSGEGGGETDSLTTVNAIECYPTPGTYTTTSVTEIADPSQPGSSGDTTTSVIGEAIPPTTSTAVSVDTAAALIGSDSLKLAIPDVQSPIDTIRMDEVVVNADRPAEVTPAPPPMQTIVICGFCGNNHETAECTSNSSGSSSSGGGGAYIDYVGGGGGGSSSWSELKKYYDNSKSTLTVAQKELLNKKLALCRKTYPKFSRMLDTLIDCNIKIGFHVSFPESRGNVARYDPKQNLIYFRDEDVLDSDGGFEELIHVVQYKVIYKDLERIPVRNIEYEAKVFYDINCKESERGCQCGMIEGSKAYTSDFTVFLEDFYEKKKFDEELLKAYHQKGLQWDDPKYPISKTKEYDPSFAPKLIEQFYK